MKILLVHQNMPGQYREMLDWLVAQGGHELVFLTQRRNFPDRDGVEKVVYAPHRVPARDAYALSKVWEEAVGAGYGAAQAAQSLKDRGFVPDIILGHTGWGELLFMKQVYPDVPILGFFEYFYLDKGGPVGFDPEDPANDATPFLIHARNAVPFANLHVADRGIVPTEWQRDCFPEMFHPKMWVCHDGIRTDKLRPDPDVWLSLGRVGRVTREDEIFTYVARNMERTRGFHLFMRALPLIQKARPNARVLIIGGNDTSYGKESTMKGGFRAEMEAEVGHLIDWDRTHFLGQVPYESFQKVIQIGRCHIYLTMPFVLSWSLLESMSMEATIVASDVAPVREAITHGETGLLTDFFDPPALAEKVIGVLSDPEGHAHLGRAAREHVVRTYDFLQVCLPRHIEYINALVPADRRIRM